MKFREIKTPLSKTPSTAIRQAVSDMRAVHKDNRYRLAMGDWHLPVFTDNGKRVVCEVCLSGSVMARRLGAQPNEKHDFEDFPYRLRYRLLGLDSFRSGAVRSGLNKFFFHNDIPEKAKFVKRRYMPRPEDGGDPEPLAKALLKLADDLAQAGA